MELNIKKSAIVLTTASLFGLTGGAFANPTSGQLVILNSVGVVVNGSTGSTASKVEVVVNDATGPCSSIANLVYGGSVTVKWNATKTHSTTQCTDITSVNVSAIKTRSGVVQYDNSANATPPATATAATTFTAPTTPVTNMTLILTGNASSASTGSSTAWGSALGVAPIYSSANGALTTTGIMGSVAAGGLKAEALMKRLGIAPSLAY